MITISNIILHVGSFRAEAMSSICELSHIELFLFRIRLVGIQQGMMKEHSRTDKLLNNG